MRAETPSEVLFDFLKCDLQINNREAARILISDKPMGSKPPPRFRIAEKTFLSRRVVHVVPGTDKIDPEMFAGFFAERPELGCRCKNRQRQQSSGRQRSPASHYGACPRAHGDVARTLGARWFHPAQYL